MVYSAATDTGVGMTTSQDWMPGLEDDAEEPPAVGLRWRRRLVVGLAGVLVLAAVVVLVVRLATPGAAPPAATSSSSAVATAAPTPQDTVIIRASLTDVPSEGGMAFNPLIVSTEPLQGGVAPDRVPHFDSCTTDSHALQYLPVQIRMPQNWLSATFTVQPTASTPAGIGRLGFFFQAGRDSTPCTNGTWATSDSFLAAIDGANITGYVVLDQAFSPTTPQGRADVFRTLQLRISKIDYGGRLPIVGTPTVGSFCPGTTRDLCASLG